MGFMEKVGSEESNILGHLDTPAANSAWLLHNCGKTISTADAAEMAGQLAILGDFLRFFGKFWRFRGYFGPVLDWCGKITIADIGPCGKG